jgi:hypothetical protein
MAKTPRKSAASSVALPARLVPASRSIAVHEAGHLAVALCSPSVVPIAVRLGPQGSGRLEPTVSVPTKPGEIEFIRDVMAVTVAGPIAERLDAGEPPWSPREPLSSAALRILAEEAPPWLELRDGSTAPSAYEWMLDELAAAYKDRSLAYPVFGAMAPGAMLKASRIVRECLPEVRRFAAVLDKEGVIDVSEMKGREQ